MIRFGLYSVLALVVAACSGMKTIEWTEDAVLSNGRAIVVKRSEEYRRVTDAGAGFETGWLFEKSRISAVLPTSGREATWEGPLALMAIDELPDGRPVVVGFPGSGRGRDYWKLDDSQNYVVLAWGPEWTRIPLAELPPTIHANLFVATDSLFITRGERSGVHLDLDRKQRVQSEANVVRRAREIVR